MKSVALCFDIRECRQGAGLINIVVDMLRRVCMCRSWFSPRWKRNSYSAETAITSSSTKPSSRPSTSSRPTDRRPGRSAHTSCKPRRVSLICWDYAISRVCLSVCLWAGAQEMWSDLSEFCQGRQRVTLESACVLDLNMSLGRSAVWLMTVQKFICRRNFSRSSRYFDNQP